RITQKLLGAQLAVSLDQQVISAPTVQAPITDGRVVITGNFTEQSAKDLAAVLNSGPLPVPLKVEHVSSTPLIRPSATASPAPTNESPTQIVRLHPGQTKTLAPSSMSPGTLVVCPHRGGVHIGPAGTGTRNSAG